ncbi:MAG TPA: phosphosulfolactate synthase [Candidatus Binatia bacterium]|nr:phosphosulfolactate synthase [Candidatus Binatia bacterium]
MAIPAGASHSEAYLRLIGVPEIAPATSPFDPGYDPATLESHLDQSAHLISILKLSMASWIVADEASTRRKVAAARKHGVPTVTGGGPFEIAVDQGQLPAYLDLCADIGVSRIECGQGFAASDLNAKEIVRLAAARALEVQFELGEKNVGPFTGGALRSWIEVGQRWLAAGAVQVVVEARESARGIGLFDEQGRLNASLADQLADAFGLKTVVFEAPTKPSQFALLDHFGREVRLSNVRLEELLRVEIYRRGLHADSYKKTKLRPSSSVATKSVGGAREHAAERFD